MKQFLYVIIAIIWIAYSLYRKQKKQREQAGFEAQPDINKLSSDTPNDQNNDFLDRYLGNKTVDYAQNEKVISSSQLSVSSFSPFEKIENKSLMNENMMTQRPITQKMPVEQKTNPIQAVSLENEETLAFEFDLRTAFIYQTILTPYFK